MTGDYYWIIIFCLFLYEIFVYLVKRDPGKKMDLKYTEESLKRYMNWVGVGSIFGAIGCIVFYLSSAGIIPANITISAHTGQSWIVFIIWVVLVLAPSLIGTFGLKRLEQTAGSKTGSSKGKNTGDEDF